MLRFFLLLFLPVWAYRQEPLDEKAVYETALREYIRSQPEHIIRKDGKQFLFVKQQEHTRNLDKTIDNVNIVYLDEEQSGLQLAEYFTKKTKFVLADMRKFFARTDINHVYIFPVRYHWNARKKELIEPVYLNRFCKSDFQTKLEERQVNYYYMATVCTKE